jgi:hypothetical protein
MKAIIKKTISMYQEPSLLRLLSFVRRHFNSELDYVWMTNESNVTMTDYVVSIEGAEDEVKEITKLFQ